MISLHADQADYCSSWTIMHETWRMKYNENSLQANIQADDSHMPLLLESHTRTQWLGKGETLIYPLAEKQSQISTDTHTHRGFGECGGGGLLVDFIKLSSSQATIWGWGPKQRGDWIVCMCVYYGEQSPIPKCKTNTKEACITKSALSCMHYDATAAPLRRPLQQTLPWGVLSEA